MWREKGRIFEAEEEFGETDSCCHSFGKWFWF